MNLFNPFLKISEENRIHITKNLNMRGSSATHSIYSQSTLEFTINNVN